MAEYRIQIHPTAYENIGEAADSIAEQASNEKAVEWLNALFRCIDQLKQMPELFQDYPSKYRILFHIDGDRVHVIQVRHGARRRLHEGEL